MSFWVVRLMMHWFSFTTTYFKFISFSKGMKVKKITGIQRIPKVCHHCALPPVWSKHSFPMDGLMKCYDYHKNVSTQFKCTSYIQYAYKRLK